MKILFIDMYAVLGGVPVVLLNRYQGLKKEFECHFAFLYDYGGTSLFDGYENVYILKNRDNLLKLIDEYNYDVISIIDSNIIYEWIAKSEYKGLIINEVHTTYQINLDKLSSLIGNPPMDVIITPSEYMKNIIEDKYKFKNVIPIEVVPNCLDLKNFIYSENKINDKVHKILWIGRLDKHKRYMDFLKICRKLKTEYKEHKFEYILVGGVNSTEEDIDELVNKSIEYDIFKDLKWYSSIEYNDMCKIYSEAKLSGGVYISTSTNESFGMTVLEAMAMGLPVVIPNVGALPELVYEYENSIYNLGDLDKACELIVKQLDNKPIYNLEKYSIDSYVKKFQYILEKYKITK